MAIERASDLLQALEDIHRPNHFKIVIERHDDVTPAATKELMHNIIKTIQIPSTIFGDIIIKRMGRSFKMPGSIDFQDVTMTLYDDIKSKARDYFTTWMQEYYVLIDGGTFNDIGNYINNQIHIHQLDMSWNIMSTTTLYNIYPKMIGELSLSHDSVDVLSEFSVVLAYSHAENINSLEIGQ